MGNAISETVVTVSLLSAMDRITCNSF